jgi:hypothetical protein
LPARQGPIPVAQATPGLQAVTHVPPEQTRPEPHWLAGPPSQHSLQSLPQRNRFAPHLRSHLVPSQMGMAVPLEGHDEQDVGPHEATLLLSLHSFPQR